MNDNHIGIIHMRNSDNFTKVISSLRHSFAKAALPTAYLLTIGISFTLALRVGIALMEG